MSCGEATAERGLGLGGSDLADALSQPPHGCARRLCFKKRGTPPDYPSDNTLLLERGRALEPLIIARYLKMRPGLKAVRRPKATHPDYPWATANVDRELLGDQKRGVGVLEAKSHGWWVFRKMLAEGLPASHILQLAWYMWIRARQWGAFVVLCPDSWQLLTFEVSRDDDLIDAILPAAESVWRQIENGPLPTALDPGDRRCQRCPWRRTCHGGNLVQAIPVSDRSVELEHDDTLDELLGDWHDAHEMAEEAAALEESIKARVKERIGARPGVQTDRFRIYYREVVSNRVDTTALRQKYPSIAKELERSVASRPLRIYAT